MDMDTHSAHMAQAMALFDPADATHVAVKDGAWTDPGTWSNGKVPGAGAMVYIPEDRAVTYDANSSAELDTVRVDGELAWATNKSTALHVDTIVTGHGSYLEIGSYDNPISSSVSATITFNDTPIDLKSDPGQLSHGLIAFGEVDIHGASKEGFVEMSATKAGAKSISVSGDLANWKVGDTIVVVGTEYMGTGSDGALRTQDEERTITAINGNTITFDKALSYDHEAPAGLDVDLYVANTSRNVVFESENPNGTRGHVMLHNSMPNAEDGSINDVAYAEFRELGRTDHGIESGTASNPIGRYPLHLHQVGTDADATASNLIGNAVSGGPGWGIVQHESYAHVTDNVVFDITGSGIVSETGNETGTWSGNLVTSVTGSAHGDGDHPQTGTEGAAYENQSRVIVQYDNIAANSKIGWNYSGRESFPEDEGRTGAPQDGSHREMFTREQLPFDPSPFDVAIDHEEPPIEGFEENVSIGTGTAFRVFHRQFSDDTDTMSVITDFTVWGGQDAVHLDNYASNYQFMDSVWQGDGTGFRIERKTSSVVFNNIEMHDFGTGYRSYGVNHEVVLIDTSFHGVGTKFVLQDLLANVDSASLRNELIAYFRDEHGIDYTNPMPKIVSSSSLTERDHVTFTPGAGADLEISPGDRSINVVGTITDSVGTRLFNDYVIAKPPSGSGSSKDFNGVSLSFFTTESDSQKEFTTDQFMALHGTWQKPDGTWVVPVVNWITDRLTADQHPVIIEIKLNGFDSATLNKYKLDEYPDPGINNPDFVLGTSNGSGTPTAPDHGGHDGHDGGDGGHDAGDGGGETDTSADEDGNLAVTVADTTISPDEAKTVVVKVPGLDGDATAVVMASDGTSTVVSDRVTANGEVVLDISWLEAGAISISVMATDAAGNMKTVSGSTLTLEAPSTDTGGGNGDGDGDGDGTDTGSGPVDEPDTDPGTGSGGSGSGDGGAGTGGTITGTSGRDTLAAGDGGATLLGLGDRDTLNAARAMTSWTAAPARTNSTAEAAAISSRSAATAWTGTATISGTSRWRTETSWTSHRSPSTTVGMTPR